jgi:hypothetical protein
VLVTDANITGVVTGITIRADADPTGATVPQIQFTAQDNLISTTNGPGIALSAVYDTDATAPSQPLSRVNAEILNNTITVGGGGEAAAAPRAGGGGAASGTWGGEASVAPQVRFPPDWCWEHCRQAAQGGPRTPCKFGAGCKKTHPDDATVSAFIAKS